MRHRRKALALLLWLVCWSSLAGAGGGPGAHLEAELSWTMVQAETAWHQGEPQIAESHYRTALQQAWTLRANLEVAEQRLPQAVEALHLATAAASDNRHARLALSRLGLHLAESPEALDEPLNELRLLIQQKPGDVAARQYLIEGLLRAGKLGQARGQLQDLTPHDAELAASLEARLEAWAQQPQAPQALAFALSPLDDLAILPSAANEQRKILRRRTDATLGRIYRNLAALHRQAERPERAEAYDALAAPFNGATTAEPLGSLDIVAQQGPVVRPPQLDPVSLFETLPESLRPVLRLIDRGDLEAAERLLRQGLETQDDPQQRALLAAVLSDQGRHDDAEKEVRSVLEMAPKMLSARQLSVRLFYLQGEPEKGARELQHAAELGPLERDLAFHLADLEIDAQRIAAANHQLRSLSRRFQSARASVLLSRNAQHLGNRKGAVDASRRALELAPDSEEVLVLHTRNALTAKLADDAAKAVEPLARMHPEVADYQFLLGSVWQALGNPREAAEAYLRAVQLEPGHQPTLLPLGLALNHESRFAEAKPFLDQALAQAPSDSDILAALAEAEERLGQTSSAEARARQALSSDPNNATAHLVLGLIDMAQGRFEAARQTLEKAVASDPQLTKAHYQLSLACARLGDGVAAKHHLEIYRQAQEGPEGSHLLLTPSTPNKAPASDDGKTTALERQRQGS